MRSHQQAGEGNMLVNAERPPRGPVLCCRRCFVAFPIALDDVDSVATPMPTINGRTIILAGLNEFLPRPSPDHPDHPHNQWQQRQQRA